MPRSKKKHKKLVQAVNPLIPWTPEMARQAKEKRKETNWRRLLKRMTPVRPQPEKWQTLFQGGFKKMLAPHLGTPLMDDVCSKTGVTIETVNHYLDTGNGLLGPERIKIQECLAEQLKDDSPMKVHEVAGCDELDQQAARQHPYTEAVVHVLRQRIGSTSLSECAQVIDVSPERLKKFTHDLSGLSDIQERRLAEWVLDDSVALIDSLPKQRTTTDPRQRTKQHKHESQERLRLMQWNEWKHQVEPFDESAKNDACAKANDQPLLCGMYVDKRLAGIQAVQTLSRLNRCYPGKNDTYVLDFVNEPGEVLDAFKTYFTTAQLSDATDPNIILDLRTKLDALGYYDEHEVDRVVKVVLDPSSKQQQLETAITPVADRLLKKFAAAKAAYSEAVRDKDEQAAQAAKDTMDALVLFRADVSTYLRAYTFLSQIFDYGNTDFEKRAIFFKYLVRLLKFGREREGVDLSDVMLTHHKLSNRGKRDLGLSDKDAPTLNPMTEIGSGAVREKQKAYLTEIIEHLNTLFGSDTTEGDQLSYANALIEKTLESEVLQSQAANNSREQFASSPDLTNEILNAVMESMDAQTDLSTRALNSSDIREGLKAILLNQLGLYEKLRSRAAGA